MATVFEVQAPGRAGYWLFPHHVITADNARLHEPANAYSRRCNRQFCYMCGATWKMCTCPKFDEGHLLRPNPTDGLDMARMVCQHVWNQHKGTACSRCKRADLLFIMQCTRCYVEQCLCCVKNRD
jgi:hypothetical protein